MQIGTFVFGIPNPEYSEVVRTIERRWAARERHGRLPALEDLGPEATLIRLSGSHLVESHEDLSALATLRDIEGIRSLHTAHAIPVFAAGGAGTSGLYLGHWVIRRLEIVDTALRLGDIPTLVEFHIEILEASENLSS